MPRRNSRFAPVRDWPSWRYGPNGEAEIFKCEADVPYGWTKKPGEIYQPPARNSLDRNQLTNLLLAKGIVARGNWSTAYMKEVLDGCSTAGPGSV